MKLCRFYLRLIFSIVSSDCFGSGSTAFQIIERKRSMASARFNCWDRVLSERITRYPSLVSLFRFYERTNNSRYLIARMSDERHYYKWSYPPDSPYRSVSVWLHRAAISPIPIWISSPLSCVLCWRSARPDRWTCCMWFPALRSVHNP